MKKFLLDTNIYTAFKSGNSAVVDWIGYAESIYINTTVAGELFAGFRAGSRESNNRLEFEQFLDSPRVHVIDQNMDTAEFYALVYNALRKKGRPIPTNDMWIAAGALQHGLALATSDHHFQEIDGLIVTDPTS